MNHLLHQAFATHLRAHRPGRSLKRHGEKYVDHCAQSNFENFRAGWEAGRASLAAAEALADAAVARGVATDPDEAGYSDAVLAYVAARHAAKLSDPVEAFVEELLTDGSGTKAERLVLVSGGGSDMGGLSRGMLADRVRTFLKTQAQQPDADDLDDEDDD